MTGQSHQYDDILHLPHHVSEKHPQMSMIDRAAQFSPFAALTGYEDAIDETARWTDTKRELTEEEQQIINAKLHALMTHEKEAPEVTVSFFTQDARKAGGTYETVLGKVKRVNVFEGTLELRSGTIIPFEDILSLE